jgi:hypothetical protein
MLFTGRLQTPEVPQREQCDKIIMVSSKGSAIASTRLWTWGRGGMEVT